MRLRKKGVEKGNNNESDIGPSKSENEEEEGFSSDINHRKMPSRRWSKDARRKSNKGHSTPDDNWGRESEEEEHMDERDRAGKQRNLGRRGINGIGGLEVSGGRKSRHVYVGTKMCKFHLPVMDMPVCVLGSVRVLAFLFGSITRTVLNYRVPIHSNYQF
jgi:hypothetical protein